LVEPLVVQPLVALILASQLVLPAPPQRPREFLDGRTLRVQLVPRTPAFETYVIAGLDVPRSGGEAACELETQRGERARRFAQSLIARPKQDILIDIIGMPHNVRRDALGRAMIRLSLNGRDFAAMMIQAGHGRRSGPQRLSWCS
jgi:endonuclease YncB( thermonuclease family)